ncbi:MAG: hypothetical protein R2828_30105 [Saprospiraceae bacterium]
MPSSTKETIKSMAFALAIQLGYTLDDQNYKRYYSKLLRQGGGFGSKFHMAYSIVDMFILSEASVTERISPCQPSDYSGCSVRYVDH